MSGEKIKVCSFIIFTKPLGEKMEFLFPKVCFYVFKRQRISPKWQPIAYIVHCFCIACCLRVKLWVFSLDYFVVILLPSLQFSSLSTVDCRLINMFSLVHTWISSCRYCWALLWSTIYTNWDVYHWCIPQPSRFSLSIGFILTTQQAEPQLMPSGAEELDTKHITRQ